MSEGTKHKIYDYEVNPPESVWERISSALDESEMHHQFPSTLYGMEVPPPTRAWDKIREALEQDEEKKVIYPAPRKIAPFLRYAVAAVLAGLIVFASLQIFKNKGGKDEVAKTDRSGLPSSNESGLVKNDTSEAVEDNNDATPLEPTQEVVAQLNQSSRSQKRNAGNNTTNRIPQQRQTRPTAAVDYPGSHDDVGLITAVAHADTRTDNKNRYVMLMTPDGNIIRMSKKLGGLVCCVSGQEQDAECKSQLKIWQEKMASSLIAPSAGNFLDIVNLVNTLQGAILNKR